MKPRSYPRSRVNQYALAVARYYRQRAARRRSTPSTPETPHAHR